MSDRHAPAAPSSELRKSDPDPSTPGPSTPGPPEFVPPTDWQEFQPPRLQAGGGTFVSGDPNGDTLRVLYYRCGDDRQIVGRAWFGPGASGPPGHAHGGSLAAVLDEAMGAAAWLAGLPSVAARLETDFVRPVPLGSDLAFEATVERTDGQKIWLSSLLSLDGIVHARAKALFIKLDPEKYRHLAEEFAESLGVTVEEFFDNPGWS